MVLERREWKGTTGGGSFGQKALMWLFRHVDVRFGYALLACVVPFYMLFNRKGYRAINDYFRNRGLKHNLRRIYRNHYLFGQMMMDRFFLFSGSKQHFTVKGTNVEYFNNLIASEGGFVIAGSHAGNFEIAGYLMHQEKKRIHSVVFGGETAILQANRAKILSGNRVEMIPVSDDMSHLFTIKAALDNGQVVSMPCDRKFGSSKSVSCQFLGRTASFPLGAFLLAAQLNVPIVALFAMREKHMTYHLYAMPVETDRTAVKGSKAVAGELVREYVQQLEHILDIYPHQWFNFFNFWE